MTDKPKPWSVKGISPEARRLARTAAQQAGMPIGRWIDALIHQQAGAPIEVDPKTGARVGAAEDRIERLVATLNGKIDGMTMRLAMVQSGRGLPAEDIAQLDKLRIKGAFEYDTDDVDPLPVIARAAEIDAEATPRAPRRWGRLTVFAVLLLISASSSYVAIAGAMTVPPAGLSNMLNQLTASVGPALRDLGIAGPAPALNGIEEDRDIPAPPLSRISARPNQPASGLDRRAANGDPRAQYELARAYADGTGRPQNLGKATQWLTEAGNRGHTQAAFELAAAYQDGRGVAADAAKAVSWYRRAAQKGHRSAQYALGMAYAEGNGVARNYVQATIWLERAAKADRADAQFALALLHERGLATDANLQSAHGWYQAAAANGFPQAAKRASSLPELNAGQPLTPARMVKDQASVQEIQRLLQDLGFDPGPVDGRIGKKTNTAIRLYQATLGLQIDGNPTDHLLAHLRKVTGVDLASSS